MWGAPFVLQVLQKALTNLHVGDFAGSDTVIGAWPSHRVLLLTARCVNMH